jgi:3-phenylpropionate/trans-cinnamate dioxygenase ferredoxin reductase subunit
MHGRRTAPAGHTRGRGVSNQRVTAFRGTNKVERVGTEDGSWIDGDLVVVGLGAQPRSELAAAAGLEVGDGILVDAHLETSVPGIFAAGDVATARHTLLGSRLRIVHWDNARRQGRAAARNMLGMAEPYERIPYSYSDQYNLSMSTQGSPPPGIAWSSAATRRAASSSLSGSGTGGLWPG